MLDTTRFIAFIPVFLTHCFITSNPLIENEFWFKEITHFLNVGLLGLDYFFVLSSFLITRLIIEEKINFKNFSFKLFFIRRSLRIWPLYFLMVGLGFCAYYLGLVNNPLPSIIHFATFTLNFYISEHGYHFLFFLVFLWSISVEEQFYIFWGIVLTLASKISGEFFRFAILSVALALISLSIVFRFTHVDNELKLYFHTFSVAGNFGIGILLAYLSVYNSRFIPMFKAMNKTSVILLTCLFLISVTTYTFVFVYQYTILFERLYFSILFALIIAVLCYSSFVSGLQIVFRPLTYLGKIALGLYFYHGIVITVFGKLMMNYPIADKPWQVMIVNPLVMLILSTVLASLSYNYFETPILAYKNRFYKSSKL